jgi:hypothetical protein
MKNITLLFSILVCFHYSNGQEYFNKIYDKNNNFNGYNGFLISDNNIFGIGNSFFPVFDSSLYLYMNLVDSIGDEIWSKNTLKNFSGISAGFNTIETKKHFIVTGATYDSIERAQDIYLYAITKEGDSVWYQNLDAGFNDRGMQIMLDKDSGFLVLGYYYLGDSDSSRITIIKTDSLGNKLWQKDYGKPNSYNFAYTFYRTEDGGLILSGERNDYTFFNDNNNFFLIKLDSLYNQEWLKEYDFGYQEYQGYVGSMLIKNDNCLLVGQQQYALTPTVMYRGILMITDISGNLIWDTIIEPINKKVSLTNIIDNEGNDYIILGAIRDSDPSSTNGKALLIKMNNYKQMMWQREIAHYTDNRFQDCYATTINKTEEGDFIFSGFILHQSSTRNDAWLVKTDSCGYTEGDVSIAQIQLESLQDSTVTLQNSSPQYCKWQWYFGNGDSSTIRNPTYTYSDTGAYTIMLITQAGNEKDTAYLTIHIGDTTVSSPQITVIQPQLKLYPNPATQYIILSGFIPQETGKAVLQFYDMQGKLVKQEPLEHGAINRSIGIKEFSQGVYAYKVFSKEKIISTGRIFIQP